MRVLVTGGTSFLGSRLIERLSLENNIEVISPSRQAGLDLRNKEFTSTLPKCDVVIHLAQSREHRNFPDKALDLFDVNVAATARLLEWSRNNAVKSFILASTGNVYEDSPLPHHETDRCRPTSYYAATKYSAELLAEEYKPFFNVIALRIFTLYGPGQVGNLIPGLIERIRSGNPITLAKGIGLQLTPLYVRDAVEMLITILLHRNVESAGSFEVYNLAGNESLSLKTMSDIISKEMNSDSLQVVTNEDIKYLSGNIEKFISAFGCGPKTSFQEGIKLTLGAYGF